MWDPATPLSTQKVFVNDSVGMQWVDTFAFGSDDTLVFTTNRLQLYFNVRRCGPYCRLASCWCSHLRQHECMNE